MKLKEWLMLLFIAGAFIVVSAQTDRQLRALHERITTLQGQVVELQADTEDLYAVQGHQTGMMEQYLEMGRANRETGDN